MWLIGVAIILLIVGEVAVRTRLEELAVTGDPDLDEPELGGRVVTYARHTFGERELLARPAILRALMAILNNEYVRRLPLYDQVGDQTADGGPSVGPMQVYRSTAQSLNLWSPPEGASEQEARTAYAAMASDLDFGISAGVVVFKAKLAAAGDDIPDAIRRYNGAGQAANNYRDKALSFASSVWGQGAVA